MVFAQDFDVVVLTVEGEVATHGEGFEDGEAGAVDMYLHRDLHLPYHRYTEVHKLDGDDGIGDIALDDEAVLEVFGQGI